MQKEKMRTPISKMRNKYHGARKKGNSRWGNDGGGGSCQRLFETVLFIIWLVFTGIVGYFVGHNEPLPVQTCPPQPAPVVIAQQVDVPIVVPKCIPRQPIIKVPPPSSSSSSVSGTNGVGYALGAVEKEGE